MPTLVAPPAPVPIQADADGVLRVGGTRVSLDLIVEAWTEGATAEGIQEAYPALALADVYGAITYYLHHRPEVDRYLEERQVQADQVRRENEARFDPATLRRRLLARRGSA